MLINLTPIVSHGIIDNTRRGIVALDLWCVREEEPIHMELAGNCLQDIAGCRAEFSGRRRLAPLSDSSRAQLQKLAEEIRKEGASLMPGDITLSRRAMAADASGALLNQLSIELFLNTHIRLLIEGDDFESELSLPEWHCSDAADSAQRMANMSALHDHVAASVAMYRGPALSRRDKSIPSCRWDAILNRAEAHMAILPTIRDKYALDPRGLLSEAFVLDKQDFLERVATEEECGIPFEHQNIPDNWEITDFMGPEEAERVRTAMRHPLFECVIEFSGMMQRYIISDLERYRDNQEVESMVAQLAGLISLVLGTIVLSQEEAPPPGLAMERANNITDSLEKLQFYHKALRPKAANKYLQGIRMLIAGLKNFVCTLRS